MAPLLKFASSTWFRRNSETPRTCTWALQGNSSTSCASSWRDLPGLDVQSKCQQHHSSLPAVVKQTLSLCPGKVQGTLSPNYPILQIKKWDVKQPAPDLSEACVTARTLSPPIWDEEPQLIGKIISLFRRGAHYQKAVAFTELKDVQCASTSHITHWSLVYEHTPENCYICMFYIIKN